MEFFKNHWKDILMAIIGIACIALMMSTTCTSRRNDVLENNIKALNDTVKTYQLKNGELMYEKQGFIAEKKELELYIDIKEKEVKDIEKKLGAALATISKLEGQINVDTLPMQDSIVHVQDTTIIHFYYSDNWLKMDGTTIYKDPFICTTLNNMNMRVPVKVGTSVDNKWFVTTDNPYITFTSVEGANLEKAKPKRWSIGIQGGVGGIFGWGISGTQDGIVHSGWILGAGGYIGLGVTYKIAEF